MSNCPFSQGVDHDLIDIMKDNEIVMREIIYHYFLSYIKMVITCFLEN